MTFGRRPTAHGPSSNLPSYWAYLIKWMAQIRAFEGNLRQGPHSSKQIK